ncbi:hypothetical protein [Paenibacillus lemnae]|uniref:Ni2+-binding GTPase n=1 Tax=Paenibacillus lemnae TaxID=1330551 RepID=A0A848M7D5_PAELE|nr:hypothetical protein [Paenibacillus lemnae]NMO96897.1 hypothetical protein [Paenibacillus lemnae]
MSEHESEWKQRIAELEQDQKLTPEAREIMQHLLNEVERLTLQNKNLRRAALKSTKQDRMSTKLKDALYE